MSLNDKERRLIPESDGESFYWKKEKDVKEFIKKCFKRMERKLITNCIKYGDVVRIIKEEVGEDLI